MAGTIDSKTVEIDGKRYLMTDAEIQRYISETGKEPVVVGGWSILTPHYYPELHTPLTNRDESGNVTGILWGNDPGIQEAGDALFGDTSGIAGKIDVALSPGYLGTQEALEAAQDPWNWYKVIGIGAAAVAAVGIGYIFTKTASEKIIDKVIK